MVELYMQKGLTPSHARRVVADMARAPLPDDILTGPRCIASERAGFSQLTFSL